MKMHFELIVDIKYGEFKGYNPVLRSGGFNKHLSNYTTVKETDVPFKTIFWSVKVINNMAYFYRVVSGKDNEGRSIFDSQLFFFLPQNYIYKEEDIVSAIQKILSTNSIPPIVDTNANEIDLRSFDCERVTSGTNQRWLVITQNECELWPIFVNIGANLKNGAEIIMYVSPVGSEELVVKFNLTLRTAAELQQRFNGLKANSTDMMTSVPDRTAIAAVKPIPKQEDIINKSNDTFLSQQLPLKDNYNENGGDILSNNSKKHSVTIKLLTSIIIVLLAGLISLVLERHGFINYRNDTESEIKKVKDSSKRLEAENKRLHDENQRLTEELALKELATVKYSAIPQPYSKPKPNGATKKIDKKRKDKKEKPEDIQAKKSVTKAEDKKVTTSTGKKAEVKDKKQDIDNISAQNKEEVKKKNDAPVQNVEDKKPVAVPVKKVVEKSEKQQEGNGK